MAGGKDELPKGPAASTLILSGSSRQTRARAPIAGGVTRRGCRVERRRRAGKQAAGGGDSQAVASERQAADGSRR